MKTSVYLGCLWLVLFFVLSAATAQRIAYVTPSGELATVASDGAQTRILADAGRYQFPAWSPGGERVAVIGADTQGAAVFSVQDAAFSQPVRHYSSQSEAPIYLYWSPDGETISFLANRPEVGLALHLAPVSSEDNTGESRLLSTGSPFYWQWTEDSQRLLVHAGLTGEDARLGFMAAAEDNLTKNLSDPGLFQAPGISASGDFIAYAEIDASEQGRVVLASATGEGERREVPHQGLAALSWSPTADLLALMSPSVAAPHTYGPIRLLDAETGDLTTLVEEVAIAFFWSPDGSKIAYLSPLGGHDGGGRQAQAPAPMMQVSAQRGVQANAQPRAPLLLNLSVVDVESGATQQLTTFAPSPLFLGQYLPFFDQYALSHRLWSPESDALALPMLAAEDGQTTSQVVVVPLRGEPRPIAQGDMPSWSP